MASHGLGHRLTFVSKANFFKGLVEVAGMDEDLNGNNGLEYVSEEAQEAGFESDAEYFATEAFKTYGITKAAIEDVLEEALNSSSYYETYEYDIFEQENDFIVSVAFITYC